MGRTRAQRLAVGLGLVGLLGCGTPNVAPELPGTPDPGTPFGGMQCSSVRPQTEPDLMGWDPGSRANLNRLRKTGVVAVRYVSQGCNVELELLSNCIGVGKYTYDAYPESQSKTLKTDRDLFAALPISAARLSGQLKGNRQLRTDYELVGTATLAAGSTYKLSDLKGPASECSRATHVVSAVYLGGFAMVAGEESKLAAKVTVFGAGLGEEEGKSMERIDKAGNPKACEEANQSRKENEGCQVPLRIGLSPLEGLSVAPPVIVAPVGALPAVAALVVPRPPSQAVPVSRGGGCPEGMVSVSGGSFVMGERNDQVSVASYCMDRSEVTVDRYAACVKAGRCSDQHIGEQSADGASFKASLRCNYWKGDGGNHPMNCVDWMQSATFCNASGQRLPSEEEWEWAARGGARGTMYPWGNTVPDVHLCWSGVSKQDGTCAVGSAPLGDSPLGIHDLAGNVWEWSSSRNDANDLVVRGGGWYCDDASIVRAALRNGYARAARNDSLGFRCARDLP
jgi:formylglycine-generating enzyme required for sulfatase activity